MSPFLGRFDDIGEDGVAQLTDVVEVIQNYDWSGRKWMIRLRLFPYYSVRPIM